MKQIALTGALLLSLTAQLFAWEIIQAKGGRTNSLGKCSVSSDDFWSVHNNPAGFAYYKDLSFGFSYENRFLLQELSYKDAGLIIPFDIGNIGLSYSQFGYEHYKENILGVGLARTFGPNLSIGLKLYYLGIRFSGDYGKKSSSTFDIGMRYRIDEKIYFGAYVFNPVNVKIKSINKDKIPIIMKLGMSYFINNDFMICGEIEENLNDNFSFRFGLEYEIYERLFIRSGFQLNTELLTFGIGYDHKWFMIDVAAQMNQYLGSSLSCSMTFKI